MNDYYILEDGKPKLEPDILKWDQWFEKNDRHIDKTENDKYMISTVFLGIDHSFGGGPPLLFETMVFKHGDWDDLDCIRYSSIKDAREGHKTVVAKWLKDTIDKS